MAKLLYKDWNPGPDARSVIQQAEDICEDYAAQGYDLTLRQLYYQFVARGLIPNNQREYSRLGDIVNKARLAGLLDWDYIVDRTRNLEALPHWTEPADIIAAAAQSYRLDKWNDQPYRVEVWVEKEALAGVVQQVAERFDVAYFSCRGYVSQSELWGAAGRLLKYIEKGQSVVVLHLGDHDPSGIDMTRDIGDRLALFTLMDFTRNHIHELREADVDEVIQRLYDTTHGRTPLDVRRIALNADQVEEYDPPPNPAKLTDSRAKNYVEEYGDESWELDALDPATLDALIAGHITEIRDDAIWNKRVKVEKAGTKQLTAASSRWAEVARMLRG